ncbi:MAG: DUF5301 domain-containing protein [Clostridiales bacterium]|nr:DUF5301 domain-containing protein [Clostridiales bacterium]
MSITGAFVIAAICLARLPLKKAPKIISYCLWAVAGFRLLIPFSIESAFSLIPWGAQPIPQRSLLNESVSFGSAASIAYQEIGDAANGGLGTVTVYLGPTIDGYPITTEAYHSQAYLLFLPYVWIAGAAVMLIYGIISYALLKRKMLSAIRVEEGIYESDSVQSPFVLGVLKPKIYIPLDLSGAEREYIILHERTHIRRGDHVVKFAAYFILCLHWFNPLAWVAFHLMGIDMEMSCDERVLREMGMEAKKDYSLSLLSLAANRRMFGGRPLAFSEGGLKQRIKNVLNFKKPSRVIIMLAVAFVAVLSAGFAVNRAAKIELPVAEDVLSVTMNRYNEYQPIGEVAVTGKIEINQLLNALSGATKTWKTSINDNPVSSEYLVVRLYLQNEMRTLYLYTEGVDYIEEPYLAIYRSKAKFNFAYSIYNEYLNDEKMSISDFWNDDINGKDMTLEDVRVLAEKGDDLLFEDLREYKGGNVSSIFASYLMVYGVEGGYRLIVSADASGGKPGRADFESIWDSGGSGIDIRYGDVDEFVRTHPSHPAVVVDEALAIAREYAGKDVELIDVDWWEYADEFPNNSTDPFKRELSKSMDSLDETCELFRDADGRFIAVGKRTGAVYTYSDGTWFAFTGAASLSGDLPSEPIDNSLVADTLQVDYNEIQQNANNGNEIWRLNPEEVAARHAAQVLNFQGTTALHRNDGSEYARVIFTKQSDGEIYIDLFQPAEKGDGGIWSVECWFDENNRMHQVRDLTALPPLFHNDENVPIYIREAVSNAIVEEWTETFSKHYQVLGFYANNVNYMETENSAELKLILTLVTQNFHKDPDTVGYIKEAKENGSLGYQQMYEEYNMPKSGSIDMKVTMSLTASGEVEQDSIQIYSNISPHGEEYVPTKAADFIISE